MSRQDGASRCTAITRRIMTLMRTILKIGNTEPVGLTLQKSSFLPSCTQQLRCSAAADVLQAAASPNCGNASNLRMSSTMAIAPDVVRSNPRR